MGQFDQTIDPLEGVNLTPDPALDPSAGLVPPAMLASAMPPSPPPVPMPAPPQAPAPQGNIAHLIQAALLGLAGGLGPRSGVGTGIVGGMQLNHVIQEREQIRQQALYKEQQQEAIRQQQLQDAQQKADEARQAKLQQALLTIRTEVKTIPDKATYDQRIEGYANLLRASGYRLDANWLRTAVPYFAPSAKQTAADALTALFKNPLLQDTIKGNPASLQNGFLMLDLNNDGIKEKHAIQEVMDVAGLSMLTDDAGKPVGLSAGTDGPIANLALKAKLATFRAENKREPTPKEMDTLITAARETPKEPKEPRLMQITETDPDTGEIVTSLVPAAKGEVSRKPPKEPNQAQFQAGAYAGRMQQSGEILDQLEKDIAGMHLLSFAAQSRLPTVAQSGTFQSYDQAGRNFVNALLRRESGAAISESEFVNARKQYLPEPGDTPTTLAQKKANRDYVFQTMKAAAGPRGYQPPVKAMSADEAVMAARRKAKKP
jgi:hypothetical protein